MTQHKKPCVGCPWRKDSARGWVGAATPVEFLQTSEDEQRMPCHNAVDYEDPNWRKAAATAPQCVGRAVHFANRAKRPRNPELLVAQADREQVFSSAQEFIDHHSLGEAPQIMLLGSQVIVKE